LDEAPGKKWIKVAHALLIKVKYTPGLKRPDIVDFYNQLLIAALLGRRR
jgi:hypothetical protein